MRVLWHTYYVHSDGRKFPYDEYTLDSDPMYTHGRKTLPDGSYTVEFEKNFSPKHVKGESLEDIMHNVMVFYSYDDMETLLELKEGAKRGMTVYPNHFPYRFMVATINLVTNEAAAWCNEFKKGIFEHPLSKEKLTDLAVMMAMREETGLGAEVVTKTIKMMMDGEEFADAYEKSLPVTVKEGELEGFVREVMEEFSDKVAEYRKGKKGIASMFVGHVMRKKKGLDPKMVVAAIDKGLNEQ